jgi:hypothetical protein
MKDLGAITTRSEAVRAVVEARYDLDTAILFLDEWDRVASCNPNCGIKEVASCK